VIGNRCLLDLVDRQVGVYSSPEPKGYARRKDYRSGDFAPVIVDGMIVGQIAVDDILP
jgi:hypothetical protein